ncbi:heavy metal transport/detoxification protein [Aphanothece hegewaldii CCALA 016]|uniref:Heavy metal transport/detoxification protein n=1 Tax=Aphanothece hegewaldii CCALA 016 TaxID=2107694 RepID=A0A2T1M1N7_9CHRO|nr:heavy metal transport/detoxification protein [Aphanothece hegewaldii]PSF38613.1 heavy metal transport/detoxification protein [Aphanothece hegewaldii CCALA 016]
MALKLNVPTLDNSDAADTIKSVILSSEPDTKIDVDLDSKTITLDGEASEETYKQLIEAAGYNISTK